MNHHVRSAVGQFWSFVTFKLSKNIFCMARICFSIQPDNHFIAAPFASPGSQKPLGLSTGLTIVAALSFAGSANS